MADEKISGLNPATLPLTGTEEAAVVQSGETKRVAVSELGGESSLYVIQDFEIINFATANTWRGHNRNFTIWTAESPNTSYGTGTQPTRSGLNFADTCAFPIKDKTTFSNLHFHLREPNGAGNIEVVVFSYDFNVMRGQELNEQVLVSEVVTITSGQSLSFDLTIAAHTLTSDTIIQAFWRRITGTTVVQSAIFTYKFD